MTMYAMQPCCFFAESVLKAFKSKLYTMHGSLYVDHRFCSCDKNINLLEFHAHSCTHCTMCWSPHPPLSASFFIHGLINYIDTCEGILRQVFIRAYRLKIHPLMLVFSTQIYELLPLWPSLWFNSPNSPLPCVNRNTVYTYIQCVRGVRVIGLRQITPATKSLYRSIFLDDDILLCCLYS